MIDALDVRTLFFVMTATALLAAVATTTLWVSHRNEAALPAWAIGAILSAVGHLCIAMRGAIPLFVSIVVANICVAVGHTLFYDGARRFSGSKPLSNWVFAGVALSIGSSFYYFSAVQQSTAIRIAIAFSFIGALSLVTGWHFWHHANAIRGQVGRVVAASFCVVGIVLLARIALYSIETPDQNFFRPDRFHHFAFFLFIMFYASLMYSFPVLLMSKELTRREAAEAELRRNELALSRYANEMEHAAQTLEEAQRIANVGSWEYDPQTRELFWSAETFRIFRRDPALGPPPLKQFLSLIHPDDLPQLLFHMDEIARTAQPYDVELRHQRPDGSYAYTVTRARPVMEDGKLKRVFGSIHDVTAYKLAESRLQASEQQLRNILETSPIAVRILALDDNTVSFANDAYARMLNLELATLRGMNPLQAYAAPEEYEKHKAQVQRGRIVSNVLMELRVPQHAGAAGSEAHLRSVWVLTSYFPIRYQDRDSSIAWFFDVTELREAKEAAEAASVAKSAFLANMSHEIRTPMNAVLGLTHLAMRKAPDPQQREYLEKIERAGRHLMGVLNDVLDFSKIESGKLEVENVPFFLSAVLDNLRQMQEYRAVEKGLSFSVRIAPDVPAKLRGDPLRIGQILINFVSNAIKFTERGSVTIDVGLVSHDESTAWLRFAVSDTGVGIAPESLNGLFEAFQQADASISRRFGGTGLGLAISRQIARLMEGRTGATSTQGVGSCFWLELPLGIESGVETGACGSVAGSREDLLDRLKGRRVLVAEDNLFNQQVAQELLGDMGIAVVLAQNGAEAISWLDRESFDAILMDMQMPVMDGLSASRAIRLRPDGKSIPIIAMTANVRHEDERACRAAGMDDFVTKPILPESLYRMLLRWLDPQSPPDEGGGDAAAPVQSAEPPAAAALLRVETLQGIAQGRPARIEKLLTSYFASVERALPALDDACRQAQHASVNAIGHQLKSGSRWVGAESIAALSVELERLPAESVPQRAPEIRDEIAGLLARLRETCETAGYVPPKSGA